MTFDQRLNIIDKTISVVIEGTSNIDIAMASVKEAANDAKAVMNSAKESVSKATMSLLQAMQAALVDIDHPITEPEWDLSFKSHAQSRLKNARRPDGRERYSSGSLGVVLNLTKVATIGLTAAKYDPKFAPSKDATSLKKYVAEVREVLQKSKDPDTGKPRLKAIASPPTKIKRLPNDRTYWLIGCETDEGIAGANTIVAADADLEALRLSAKELGDKFKSYLYIEAPQEPEILNVSAEPRKPAAIQNSAVFTSTI